MANINLENILRISSVIENAPFYVLAASQDHAEPRTMPIDYNALTASGIYTASGNGKSCTPSSIGKSCSPGPQKSKGYGL